MEFINCADIAELANPGVVSRQLLWSENSNSKNMTLTEVHLISGAEQPRHTHKKSEQVWYALQGSGQLLLADDCEAAFAAGDVVRFEKGDVHGLRNDGDIEFVYISVTSPPLNFSNAYRRKK